MSTIEKAKLAAEGRWLEYLEGKWDIDINDGKPTSCPICGGDDRFTFNDFKGEGNWYCRGPKQANGKREPHFGDGLDLIRYALHANGKELVSANDIALDVLNHFNVEQPPVDIAKLEAKRAKAKAKKKAVIDEKTKRALTLLSSATQSIKEASKESEWEPASVALSNHPYVTNKGIADLLEAAHSQTGTAVAPSFTGHQRNPRCIAVSYVDLESDTLCGVELIAPNGEKRTTGSKGVHILPYHQTATTALVVEGWATGVTLNHLLRANHLADTYRVVIAGGCGKAEATARALRQHRGLTARVIYEDDGAGTPEGELHFPVFNGGNDCADWFTHKAPVRNLIEQLQEVANG